LQAAKQEQLHTTIHIRTNNTKTRTWGRVQREAAQRRNSDWRDNLGGAGLKSAPSNATWRTQSQ